MDTDNPRIRDNTSDMVNVPRKNKPTMIDVAKEARVSVATVSRVVNGKGGVSKELEQRVSQAVNRLNYYPSILARSFKKQRTKLVGVMIPLLDHPFYGQLATAIEQTLFVNDYRALVCNTVEDEAREKAYIEILLQQRADGVIVNSSAQNTDHLSQLERQRVPFVLIDRDLCAVGCSKVFSDNFQGGFIGIRHLVELGHSRIGVVVAPTYPELIHQRVAGTREAVKAYGIDDDPQLLIAGDTQKFDMGYAAAIKLLHLKQPPTAIFALTDVMAVGVLHAAAKMRLRVPDDLSVLGYDDISIASYTIPPLTTVAQPITEMGATAVELLLYQMRDPESSSKTVVLETHLVIRQSTAPPKRAM